ncbi:MAG: hypothetical protein GQ544_06225 [Candidatus Aminicenantes bacterium]|nr:hypothetical protein [Candidatus Aminicenantes bacterium]
MRSKIYRILILSFVIFSFTLTGFAADKKCESKWTAAPINLDASETEWQDVAYNEEGKFEVNYAFKNDSKYLYVLFKFNSPKFLSTIQYGGMTMYLDGQGKKKKDYRIRFLKKQVTAEEFIVILEKQRGTLSEEDKEKILINPQYIHHAAEVTNKKAKGDRPENVEGDGTATFRVQQTQQRTLIMEFAIPLERLSAWSPGIGTTAGSPIKVGFEWGGASEEWKEAQLKGAAGRDSQARAGRATGSATQERGSGGGLSGSMSRFRPKKYYFWVDVLLSDQQ